MTDPHILRIDYPGFVGDEELERISWDEWFDSFEKHSLAFSHQSGRSRFAKLVDRESLRTHARALEIVASPHKKPAPPKKKPRPSTKKKVASKPDV